MASTMQHTERIDLRKRKPSHAIANHALLWALFLLYMEMFLNIAFFYTPPAPVCSCAISHWRGIIKNGENWCCIFHIERKPHENDSHHRNRAPGRQSVADRHPAAH